MQEDRELFQPINEKARWRICYDVLREHEIGDVVSYQKFLERLDEKADRSIVQKEVRKAATELLSVDRRWPKAVVNQGYRIIRPEEHVQEARTKQKESQKRLTIGHALAVQADRNLITDSAVRDALDMIAHAFMLQRDFNRQIDVRQKQLASAVAAIETRSQRTAAEVDEIRQRLARLEQAEAA